MKAFSTHTRRWTTALFTGLLVVGLTTIGQADAGEVVDGNPTCAGFDYGDETENPSGTYVIDEHGLSMTLTVGTHQQPGVDDPNPNNAVLSYTVHASSEVTTGQIIVKGSNGAIIYQFGEATPLHAPVLDNGKWPTISHVQVCWDEPEPGPEYGRIELTKAVTGNGAPTTTEFELCITGPAPNTEEQCETIGAGETATFDNLEPGTYAVTETDPGTNWTVTGEGNLAVTADTTSSATIINTYEVQQQQAPVAPPTTPVTPPSTPVPPPAAPVTPPATPVTPPTVSPSGGTVGPTTQPETASLPVTGPSIRILLGQAGVATALLAVGTVLLRLGRRPEHMSG